MDEKLGSDVEEDDSKATRATAFYGRFHDLPLGLVVIGQLDEKGRPEIPNDYFIRSTASTHHQRNTLRVPTMSEVHDPTRLQE